MSRLSPRIMLLAVLAAVGSTTLSPATAQVQTSGTGAPHADPCGNTAVAAIGGALLGALIGGKHNRTTGAVVGGALGAAACLAVNYHSRQVKTVQQVNQDYQKANGSLPEHATLVRFDNKFDPTDKVQPGGASSITSYIEVAQGTDGVKPNVEEEMTLFSPDGKQLNDVRKPANSTPSGGAFQTQFAFTMPKGVPEGVYPFKTTLFINGENVSTSDERLQVVTVTGERVLASN